MRTPNKTRNKKAVFIINQGSNNDSFRVFAIPFKRLLMFPLLFSILGAILSASSAILSTQNNRINLKQLIENTPSNFYMVISLITGFSFSAILLATLFTPLKERIYKFPKNKNIKDEIIFAYLEALDNSHLKKNQ